MISVDLDQVAIVIVRDSLGELHALRDRCSHQGARLSAGYLEPVASGEDVGDYRLETQRQVIRCPAHRYEFDLDTGQSLADPLNDRVKTYDVKVEEGVVVVYR
jgi:nitrite reductase/ring-hydroxylating ferredoxin subunit